MGVQNLVRAYHAIKLGFGHITSDGGKFEYRKRGSEASTAFALPPTRYSEVF